MLDGDDDLDAEAEHCEYFDKSTLKKIEGQLALDGIDKFASMSSREATNLPVGKRGSSWERGGDSDIGVKKKGDAVVLNLMKSVDYAGPVCVLFRVYKPLSHSITPEDALPKTYYIPRKERAKFDFSTSTTSALVPVKQAKRKSAFAAGKRVEGTFCSLIQKHL